FCQLDASFLPSPSLAGLPAAVPCTGRAGGIQGVWASGGAASRLSAQRLLQLGHVILPGRLGESSARAGWGYGRAGRRKAKVVEDGRNRPGRRVVGEAAAASAAG